MSISKHLNNTNFRHQARAVEILGFGLSDVHGSRVQAANIPLRREVSHAELNKRPTMLEFLRTNDSEDVLICSADRIMPGSSTTESHTFAVDRQWYFDNNTGGCIVPIADAPNALADFRVGHVLAVRPRRV